MPGSSRLPVSLRDTLARETRTSRSRLVAKNLNILQNVLLLLFLLRWTRKFCYILRYHGPIGSLQKAFVSIRRALYGYFLRLPGVRGKVQAQVSEAITKMQGELVPSGPDVEKFTTLPKDGWDTEKIMAELEKLESMKHTKWEDGRVSGAVYHGGRDLIDLQARAWGKFAVTNPIHPDAFPAVRKMEAEVVAMVLSLFRAPGDAAGVTTSGGTESILMAVLSARQKALIERNVTEPEMILPSTAHTAFRKAAQYFKIKTFVVKCPGPSYKVHIPSISSLINSNTILLVGSAPNFPHGIIDDISALSRLAVRRKVPLHVDCCLGSFLMPFLARAGFATEPFDFSLVGVTSISCDTHKYGFAPKGSSTVLYRTQKLRSYQYFIDPNWSGGVYASPSMAGSRPGALIASCWVSLMNMGESGYIDSCHKIVGAARTFEDAIREDPALRAELKVIGKPLVSVVAFTASSLDVYDIADAMSSKGWHLNALQDPPAIHVAFTLPIQAAAAALTDDLKKVVAQLRDDEDDRIRAGQATKGASKGNAAALYGVAGSLPSKTIVEDLARGFLDTLYKT